MDSERIVGRDELILVTGANGFIGARVVEALLSAGLRNLRCFVRPSGNRTLLEDIIGKYDDAKVEIFEGNLLSRENCHGAAAGAALIYNLVAGMESTFAGCFMNSVVTLRNLLEATLEHKCLKRFVQVSSFAVYSNINMSRGSVLDETCPMEERFMERYEAYCFGKAKQDEMLSEYGIRHKLPYVIVRPGVPYGPGVKTPLHSRIGIDTFGVFFHLGGNNEIPLTYIDNCAEAIVMAGLRDGIGGEVFNIVDDDLPTSRRLLRLYKSKVTRFHSIYIPFRLFYLFCHFWEKYSRWSGGQLPPAFNRRKCAALWKGNQYSNKKLKDMVGWRPRISFSEGSKLHFEYLRKARGDR